MPCRMCFIRPCSSTCGRRTLTARGSSSFSMICPGRRSPIHLPSCGARADCKRSRERESREASMPIVPMDKREGVIWFNGEFVPWGDAKVHVLTHGLHYASAVIEGQRAYGG